MSRTPATVEYVCDWNSENGDDQRGHIKVTTATGTIEATWSATGGRGDGAELVTNTTKEFTNEQAEILIDTTDLCQGNGSYTADLVEDSNGWYDVENVNWIG